MILCWPSAQRTAGRRRGLVAHGLLACLGVLVMLVGGGLQFAHAVTYQAQVDTTNSAAPAAAVAGESTVVLRGSGPTETSALFLKALQSFSARANYPFVRPEYRVNPTDAVKTDFNNDASTLFMHFGVGHQPFSSTAYTTLTASTGVVHVPVALTTYGIYFNLPGMTQLNLTGCLLARIFSGDIKTWSHTDITTANPNMILFDTSPAISVLLELQNSTYGGSTVLGSSTTALKEYLTAATASGCSVQWTSSTSFLSSATQSATVPNLVLSTQYSITVLPTSTGKSFGLSEVSISNKAGAYMVSTANNASNMQSALASVSTLTAMASPFNGSWAGVSAVNLPGANVWPITMLTYIYLRKDYATYPVQAGVAQAFAKYALSSSFQSTLAAAEGHIGVGSSVVAYGTAAINTITATITVAGTTTTLSAVSSSHYVWTTSDSYVPQTVSPVGQDYAVQAITSLTSQVATLKAQVDLGVPRLLRGAGSSAIVLFISKIMDVMMARAATPVWMTYRGIGSGGGETEFVGAANKAGAYVPYVDFGASDVALTTSSWQSLKTNSKSVIQLPILLAAMNFFVNLPSTSSSTNGTSTSTSTNSTASTTSSSSSTNSSSSSNSTSSTFQLQLSPCTAAAIFQGDIKTWDDPLIAADNGGAKLPSMPITVYYRNTSSGTNAVITEYLTRACPSGWRLGSGRTINMPSTAIPVTDTSLMAVAVKKAPYSIGYMDVGFGFQQGLMEAAIKNKNGFYVTSTTADVPSAALGLFKAGGFPSDPRNDWSGVSLLNQAGDNTFPIVSMPCAFVRTDLTDRGDSGTLLQAFMTFMLSNEAQALLTSMYYSPLPAEIRSYALTRALPLLAVDTRAKVWAFESTPTAGAGAADNIFSAYRGTYVLGQADTFYTFNQARIAALAAGTNTSSNSTFNATDLTTISGVLKKKLDDQDKQIKILKAISICALVFGAFGVAIGMFASCRMVAMSGIFGSNSMVYPVGDGGKSMTSNKGDLHRNSSSPGGMSLRRPSYASRVSDMGASNMTPGVQNNDAERTSGLLKLPPVATPKAGIKISASGTV